MLRRLHKDQPASFALALANPETAWSQISESQAGHQASAAIVDTMDAVFGEIDR